MISFVYDYQIDDVFKKDAQFYYVIPKSERMYVINPALERSV